MPDPTLAELRDRLNEAARHVGEVDRDYRLASLLREAAVAVETQGRDTLRLDHMEKRGIRKRTNRNGWTVTFRFLYPEAHLRDAIDAAMSSLPHEEDRTSAPTLRKE